MNEQNWSEIVQNLTELTPEQFLDVLAEHAPHNWFVQLVLAANKRLRYDVSPHRAVSARLHLKEYDFDHELRNTLDVYRQYLENVNLPIPVNELASAMGVPPELLEPFNVNPLSETIDPQNRPDSGTEG